MKHLIQNQLSTELRKALDWMQANPQSVAMQSLRECARRADLAPTTLTRLAKALGFESYAGLKKSYQDDWSFGKSFSVRAEALQTQAKHSDDWFEQLSFSQHANTASVSALNSPSSLSKAAQAVLKAKTVYVFGLRASHGIAFHLQYSLNLLLPNVVLVQDMGGTLLDQIARIDKQDVLISISQSPYTTQTIQLTEQAARGGATILALTDGASSPLALYAQYVLCFSAQSNSYFQSMVGLLALVELFLGTVAVTAGEPALIHLRTRQAQLADQNAYWTDSPKKITP
jgi:DNA-binding MurR/RpiR family transcriptional regulator